jgi:divalent metal cation (Fe/Co/Zn/Cd) transporter
MGTLATLAAGVYAAASEPPPPTVPNQPSIAKPVDALARSRIVLLQWLTIGWMLIECAVSLVSAARAHSVALAAFGADSLVELFSAALVVFALAPGCGPRRWSDRTAGILLFVLAVVVAVAAVLGLAGKVQPERSFAGIAISAAALVVMPLLAWQKRRLALESGLSLLAADAVQSATCAYLALITLAGLAVNAIWHYGAADSLAALLATPILIVEGRRAMRGESCGCH